MEQALLDMLEVGLVQLDAQGQVLWGNARAAQLLGTTPAVMRERNALDPRWDTHAPDGELIPPEQRPIGEALRTGRAVRGQVLNLLRGDGGRIWLRVDVLPRLDANGQVRDALGCLVDLSQERVEHDMLEHLVDAAQVAASNTAAALVQERSRHRATIESMAEGVFVHGPDGAIIDANRAATEILKLSRRALLAPMPSTPRWRLLDEQGAPLAPQDYPSERTRRTGEPCERLVVGHQWDDRAPVWVRLTTRAIRAAPGTSALGVVATFTDITQQLAAERELKASRERLQRLTSAVPGVLFEYELPDDGPGHFRFLSEGARSILQLEPEAPADQVWGRLAPEDAQRLQARWASTRLAPATIEEELRLVGPGERWTRWRTSPPTHEGRSWLLHGLVLDVTEQRRLDAILRDVQRQEPLGVLAAGIAHNFNNMLAVISPALAQLKDHVSPALQPSVDDAYRAAQSAATLVRQLMQQVRREDDAQMTTFDLDTLAAEVVSLCKRTFDPQLVVELRPSPGATVRGQRAAIQQVLLNLCINARDAMAAVTGRARQLRVEVELSDALASVAVADTGEGLPPEVAARLGEPFFTTKPPGKGTGLGVATAVGIARDHGGALTWSSQAGVGSRFVLSLPRARAPEVATPSAGRRRARPFAGQQVLVIDDEPLVRRALCRQLRLLGLTAMEAEGGKQGLAMVGPQTAAVLVDLSMPEMGGEEVLRAIKASHPALPVLVLSGFVPDDLALDQANGVLHKPCEPEVLEEHLRVALRESGPHGV